MSLFPESPIPSFCREVGEGRVHRYPERLHTGVSKEGATHHWAVGMAGVLKVCRNRHAVISIIVCLLTKLVQLQRLQFFSDKGPPTEKVEISRREWLEATLPQGKVLLAIDVILRWHLSVQLLYNVVLLQLQWVLCIFCDGCRQDQRHNDTTSHTLLHITLGYCRCLEQEI